MDNWASWNTYRLSQLTADAFSIRKRANDTNPWIGTFSGTRSEGYAFAGDVSGGLGLCLHDFWQSYPSAIEISETKAPVATLTAWLWSPDAEPMDLRHYDNVAHDLNASYEDVQEGLSTPYGIARTTTLTLIPQGGYAGKKAFADRAKQLSEPGVLMPTPKYLHAQQAFGVWSLPDRSTPFRSRVEDRLDAYIDFYKRPSNRTNGMVSGTTVMSCMRMILFATPGDTISEALLGTIQNWPPICGFGIIFCAQGVQTFGVWQRL